MYKVLLIFILLAFCATSNALAQTPISSASTGIPADFEPAGRFLFDNGMDDPIGGEFRTVTVDCGDSWHGSGPPAEVTGWVVSGEGAGARVVCWNDLANTAISVGEPTDLSAFVRHSIGIPQRLFGAQSEREALSTAKTYLAVALLLRVGQRQLAETVYASMPHVNEFRHSAGQMIRDYVWNRYIRAVAAH